MLFVEMDWQGLCVSGTICVDRALGVVCCGRWGDADLGKDMAVLCCFFYNGG